MTKTSWSPWQLQVSKKGELPFYLLSTSADKLLLSELLAVTFPQYSAQTIALVNTGAAV